MHGKNFNTRLCAGNSISLASTLGFVWGCITPCAGAPVLPYSPQNLYLGAATEICGGPSRLSIYQVLGTPVPTPPTTLIPTHSPHIHPSSSPTILPTTSPTSLGGTVGVEYIGCFADCGLGGGPYTYYYYGTLSSTIANRALPYLVSKADFMTIASCKASASEQGFEYFGLQDGFQCFAGSNLTLATSQGSGLCESLCPGASNEICGGGVCFFKAVGSSLVLTRECFVQCAVL